MRDQSGVQKVFKIYYAFMLAVTGLAIAVIGILQPYMADDYTFLSLVKSNQGLSKFLGTLYFQWTGRLQGAFFLWLGAQNAWAGLFVKAIHGPVLLGTAFLSLALALGRWPQIFRKDRLAFLFSLASLWFGLPFLSEVVFWDSGAAFYLLPMFFGLLFLVPFRKWLEYPSDAKPQWSYNLVMLLLGLWVGFGQEQLVIGLSLFLLFFWYYQYKRRKEKNKVPTWLIYGTAGFVLGVIILTAAPGNYVRLGTAAETGFLKSLIIFLGYIFFVVVANAWRDWWPWLAGIALLAKAMKKAGEPDLSDAKFILVWAIIGFATLMPILFLSSFVVDRAAYFAIIFWNIAFLSVLRNKSMIGDAVTSSKTYILVAALLVNMIFIDAALGIRTAYATRQEVHSRERIIAEAKGKGAAAVELPPFTTKFRRTTFISDITTGPESWLNKSAAEYYGLKSIKLNAENQDYKDVKAGELTQLLRSVFHKNYKSTN
jgi:hypothetical protein